MRHIVNFSITGFLILVFQWLGWLEINQDASIFVAEWANQLVVAGAIGLVFTIALWLAGLVFTLFVVVTLGVGCLLFPIFYALLGAAGFWLIGEVLPGWITLNANTWQIILMGIMVGFLRIGSPSSSSSSSDD